MKKEITETDRQQWGKYGKRFHPVRILLICGVNVISGAGLLLIVMAVFGFFKGNAPEIPELLNAIKIGSILGIIYGFTKL